MGKRFSRRSVGIGLLLALAFVAGIATSYKAMYNKYEYAQKMREAEIKAGTRITRDPSGKVVVQPTGEQPGTDRPDPNAPAPAPDQNVTEPEESEATLGNMVPPLQKELSAAERERLAQLRAHTEPTIGLFLIGKFNLKDQNGKAVTEKSWPGKFLLIMFGFTRCPDVCPVTLAKMEKAIDGIGSLGDRIQPIFITVDPEHDTPEVMKEYVGRFGKRFVGLTGTPEQIKAAEESYKVYAAKRPPEGLPDTAYTMDHSAFVYLMSPETRLEEVFRIAQGTQEISDKLRIYMLSSQR